MCALLLSHVRLFATTWTVAHELLCPWNSAGTNTGVDGRFLLQGIFLTQGLNPGLPCFLHCRWILYHWALREAPDCFFKGDFWLHLLLPGSALPPGPWNLRIWSQVQVNVSFMETLRQSGHSPISCSCTAGVYGAFTSPRQGRNEGLDGALSRQGISAYCLMARWVGNRQNPPATWDGILL